MWKYLKSGFVVDTNGKNVATVVQNRHGPMLAAAPEAIALLVDIKAMADNGEITLDTFTYNAIEDVILSAKKEGNAAAWEAREPVSRGEQRLASTSWRDKLWTPRGDDSWGSAYGRRSHLDDEPPKPREPGLLDPSALMAKAVSKKRSDG